MYVRFSANIQTEQTLQIYNEDRATTVFKRIHSYFQFFLRLGLPTSAMIKAQYRVVVCIFKNAIGTKILSQRNEKFDVYEAKKTLTHKRSIKLLQNKLFQ